VYNYLVVDGMINGTGVRNYYEGGYIELSELNLSIDFSKEIEIWLEKYWEAFYNEYNDNSLIDELDNEGLSIAQKIQKEVNCKVLYYSDAKQKRFLF